MNQVYKEQNGYIALITLIIIGAVVLISVITLTFVALKQKNFIISHNYSMKNYYAANACANYAILQLQKNLEYSGNEAISLEDIDCKIEKITGTGNDNRVVITSSQINNQSKKIKVELEQVKPVTIIKSWGETSE
ncbi:MAG: hypothetical protein NTZ49_05785 [Candidatus Parcubacteria bacterium]|nr:hypothetical protein [Candidatus Parcubacteria bacterium]